MHIPIRSSSTLVATPQKTEMELSNGELFIPEALYNQIGKYIKEDALALLSMLETFPTAFTLSLRWERARVDALTQKLRSVLATMDPELNKPRPQHSFGAKHTPRS